MDKFTKRDREIYRITEGRSVYLHFRRRMDIVSTQGLSGDRTELSDDRTG